jgi:hypothetical protein
MITLAFGQMTYLGLQGLRQYGVTTAFVCLAVSLFH